jgi:hypothetical protein
MNVRPHLGNTHEIRPFSRTGHTPPPPPRSTLLANIYPEERLSESVGDGALDMQAKAAISN